jgi:hypothetical protein
MIGAKIHCVNLCIALFKLAPHTIGQRMKIGFGVIPPPNAGLVGNHHHTVTQTVCGSNQLKDSIDKIEVFRTIYVGVIDINNPIPFQKESWMCVSAHRMASSFWAR